MKLRFSALAVAVACSAMSSQGWADEAAAKKWIDEKDVVLETLTAIKRAGADVIITYHAGDALRWLADDR